MRVLLALALCWPLLCSAQYLDADTPGEAFTMVYLERAGIEGTRKLCIEALPEHRKYFDYSVIQWADNNEAELWGLDQVSAIERKGENLEEAFRVVLAANLTNIKSAMAVAGSERVCGHLVEKIANGERNIAKRTPKASRFLTDYLAAHPLSKEEEGRRNMTDGCTKAFYNKEATLDFARSACPCMTNVYYTQLTPDELAEFDRVARARESVAALPAVQRIAPEISKCVAEANGK